MSSQVTVKQLAEVLGVSIDKLLSQLESAGVNITDPDAMVSNEDKKILLAHLRVSHGKEETAAAAPKRVTLKRRTVSEITVPGGARVGGRAAPPKTVNVEVRRKRTYVKRGGENEDTVDQEREAARKALEEIRYERGAEEREREAAAEAERKKAEEIAEREAEIAREKAKKEAELQAKRDAEEKAKKEAEDKEKEAARLLEEQEAERKRAAARIEIQREEKKRRESNTRGGGRDTRYGRAELHVTAGAGGRRKKSKPRRRTDLSVGREHGFQKPAAPVKREIQVPENISVADLAKLMAVKSGQVIKATMQMGMMVTINQMLDQETAILVVEEMGYDASVAIAKDIEAELVAEQDKSSGEGDIRPPVVTIMGHVDHGKTSLLDYIRKTQVADGEAGGITQHIGAYHVKTEKGGITFLDTPGHAAFTAMRARGAQVTDIVILVVAADDGVMPQTKEAIQHARAANVPLIIAVNKIDRESADLDRVKNELSKEEVIAEDWGGEDIFVNVSAKTGEGVDSLLEAISVQAEVMELRADASHKARGVVIESRLDKGRGPVATLLILDGTLRKGEMVLAGEEYGRSRSMLNELGETVTEVGPSFPVEIIGLSGVPNAGDEMIVVANERKAKEAASQRQAKSREGRLAHQQATKLQNLFDQMGKEGEQQTVNLIIKADVQGSVEALSDALTRLSNDQIIVNVVVSGVGGIIESDATLAQASSAIVIGFNVRADASARRIIKENDLDLHYYSVIYDAIDQVKAAISGLLGTETKEEIIGLAEVKDVFRSTKLGAIAGCLVVEGSVKRQNPIRVLRDNVVIFEGELESLRRFKDEANEVNSGTECGIGVKQYNDVRPGDQIECFERFEVARTLD